MDSVKRHGSKRGGGNFRGRGARDKKEQESNREDVNVDESSPVIQLFRSCRSQLDAKHDRHERIVKLSRDITIESKRVIFLLHRVSGNSKEQTLDEADIKLKELQDTLWLSVAKELQSQDPYQFLRAYSPGLQEYIEATSLYHYLKYDTLISLQDIVERLTKSASQNAVQEDACPEPNTSSMEEQEKSEVEGMTQTEQSLNLGVHVPPLEYMLGIADLTGELMRLAINSVGNGDFEKPAKLCKFMRSIYDAFVSFGNTGRELNQKLKVLKQSLVKVENACYNLQVRGSEIPKHMLKDVFSSVDQNTANITSNFEDYPGADT